MGPGTSALLDVENGCHLFYKVCVLGAWAQFRIPPYSAACNGEFNLEGSCHAEGKLKFFAWLLAQGGKIILTADKLAPRHWPWRPPCSFRDQETEALFIFAFTALSFFLQMKSGVLVEKWVGECIVDIDEGVQTTQIWWEKSCHRREGISGGWREKKGRHLDVLSLDFFRQRKLI